LLTTFAATTEVKAIINCRRRKSRLKKQFFIFNASELFCIWNVVVVVAADFDVPALIVIADIVVVANPDVDVVIAAFVVVYVVVVVAEKFLTLTEKTLMA